jgi:hypothetical protein
VRWIPLWWAQRSEPMLVPDLVGVMVHRSVKALARRLATAMAQEKGLHLVMDLGPQ